MSVNAALKINMFQSIKGFQYTIRIDNKIYYNIQGNSLATVKYYLFDL